MDNKLLTFIIFFVSFICILTLIVITVKSSYEVRQYNLEACKSVGGVFVTEYTQECLDEDMTTVLPYPKYREGQYVN